MFYFDKKEIRPGIIFTKKEADVEKKKIHGKRNTLTDRTRNDELISWHVVKEDHQTTLRKSFNCGKSKYFRNENQLLVFILMIELISERLALTLPVHAAAAGVDLRP